MAAVHGRGNGGHNDSDDNCDVVGVMSCTRGLFFNLQEGDDGDRYCSYVLANSGDLVFESKKAHYKRTHNTITNRLRVNLC